MFNDSTVEPKEIAKDMAISKITHSVMEPDEIIAYDEIKVLVSSNITIMEPLGPCRLVAVVVNLYRKQ
jgi:hypothetical protein